MKTNDTRYMQQIMSVIAANDPDTFKAIEAADWQVTIVDTPRDLLSLALNPNVNPFEIVMLMVDLSKATGITLIPREDTPPGGISAGNPTWLNRPYIEENAAISNVTGPEYGALTLVHEFTHHNGELEEGPAYDADIAFALKMGHLALAAQEREDKAVVTGEGERLLDRVS